MFETASSAVAWLRTPEAIRERCGVIFAAAERDALRHFAYRPERLPELARFVAGVIRQAYPSLDIPYHARWRHFAVGGHDRWGGLARKLSGESPAELARIRFSLAVTSVLLDAGAGPAWRYREPATGETYARSEGLAVASFDLFASGAFSSMPERTLRGDADGLARMTAGRLAAAFQVGPGNELIGLEGRAELLRRLASALRVSPDLFGTAPPRVGSLFDYLAASGRVAAPKILDAVLHGFGSIWPGRIELGGVNLGDVWRHPAIGGSDLSAGLVPFHKLSQWLTYSLVEPLEDAGITVTDIDKLTGLPEYRNGGLFVDGGVLVPRHEGVLRERHAVDSEVVVEWRALTVVLLDRIAPLIGRELGRDLPLAKVLEGGTWAAGRRLAAERRPGGVPPITVDSDGTVF
ncbi:MAG TPA: URC4/urg3 family protein [Alphaproteobacteria bacterium]|nr:URC4/urg3 family protein [Alphaproteobacteria bacterium]